MSKNVSSVNHFAHENHIPNRQTELSESSHHKMIRWTWNLSFHSSYLCLCVCVFRQNDILHFSWSYFTCCHVVCGGSSLPFMFSLSCLFVCVYFDLFVSSFWILELDVSDSFHRHRHHRTYTQSATVYVCLANKVRTSDRTERRVTGKETERQRESDNFMHHEADLDFHSHFNWNVNYFSKNFSKSNLKILKQHLINRNDVCFIATQILWIKIYINRSRYMSLCVCIYAEVMNLFLMKNKKMLLSNGPHPSISNISSGLKSLK